MKRVALAIGLAALFTGCALLEQFRQLSAFTRCEFRLVSVENQTLAGIRIAGKRSPRDFGLRDAARFGTAVAGGALPLAFTLNVEVRNPNAGAAAMNRMAWILLIDDIEMTRGEVEARVEVPPNGTAPLPLAMEVDLRQVMTGQSLDAMVNLAFNVAGEGTRPTRVSLRVRPSIMVAGQSMDFPDYITVTAEYGGGGASPVR